MADEHLPVLIVGAGISGLILAQYLKTQGVPFQIFERDSAVDARSGGWGLTLHWALPALRQLLPEEIVAQLPETYVNKEAAARGDTGRYQFFDLKSGEALYNVPAAERIRVSRVRMRQLLTSGIDVQWNKSLKDIESTPESVTAHFEDGSSWQGRILLSCDVLDTPNNFSDSTDKYHCQLIVSWAESKGIDVPESNADRIALMKSLTANWADPFRSLIHQIPDATEVVSIRVADWIFTPQRQRDHPRVVLVGDSAHTMTMFRGEGANNAIVDVQDLVKRIDFTSTESFTLDALRSSVAAYEQDIFVRAETSVLNSRQACLDAHDFEKILNGSPLVSKRVLKEDK
ncbi:hypothetical protein APSETT444_005167 [Aspergillus pseudonomiae]